jgi:CRP-like cAMP-binding protein
VAPDATAALAGVPVFAELAPAELEQVAGAFREHTFEPGSHIFREGERGARVLSFFVVTSGTVVVAVGGEIVRRCGPGDVVGEIGLLDDAPRTATVTAETDVSCLGVSAWAFDALVAEHPAIGLKLAETAEARRTSFS